MDITTVEMADKQTLYMTILSGWGLISDIDIESESLRRIGDSRFVLGNIYNPSLVWEGIFVISQGKHSHTCPLSLFPLLFFSGFCFWPVAVIYEFVFFPHHYII